MPPTRQALDAYFTADGDAKRLDALIIESVPAHIAIIMDGNGRWAASKGLPRIAGHHQGALSTRDIVRACGHLGVKYLTLYSFSSENWNRPADEVSGLMRLFVEAFDRETALMIENDVRLRIIGRREELPQSVQDAADRCERNTAHCSGLNLLIAINYGGRAEILDAATSLARDTAEGRLSADDISEDVFASRLTTAGIPDPDLIVRTSGEFRVSNFLLWQMAYSEIHVTDTFWPDFGPSSLLDAVLDYQSRSRRFGG